MSDKGIIFSAPMVRALLEGRKSQTRRLLKPAPVRDGRWWSYIPPGRGGVHADDVHNFARMAAWSTPYAPGDRLYVREACFATELADDEGRDGVIFLADNEFVPIENSQQAATRWLKLFNYGQKAGESPSGMRGRGVPSIHMPRWASRLTLTVTDVRVQRVAEISETDALAEGVERHPAAPKHLFKAYEADGNPVATARASFRGLWNSLHTEPGETWADSPWVVAVSFSVAHGNIDTIPQGSAGQLNKRGVQL